MTVSLELLFPHLDELIQTPADVQRLNEAILQLAVQGKLVPQDPYDEPAEMLLKRIAVEKAQLLGEDKIRKSKPIPSVELNETPYELPKGWEWVRLGEIVTLWNGRAYSREELLDAGTPIIRIQNLNDGDQWYYSDLNLSPEKYCDTGDLLYAWSGTFGPYIWQGGKSIYHYHIWRVDLYCQLNKLFVFHFLKHISESVRGDAHGVMLLHMTKQGMEQLPFPLPPLAEQKRIVAKVDELFAQTRALAANLRRAEAAIVVVNRAVLHQLHHAADNATFQHAAQLLGDHFDLLYTDPRPVTDLRQTILQLAVQGKLVAQDPNDEPAVELLKRIGVEKERLVAAGKIKKEKSLPSIDEDDVPFVLPVGWAWVRLSDLAKVIDYGTSVKADKDFGDIPILRMNNIRDGKVLLDSLKYVPLEIDDLPRLFLERYDLLFNRTNSYELVGKTGVFKAKDGKYTFASYLIRIGLHTEHVESDYVNFYFNSPICRTWQIEPNITQQTGQANFNGTKLKNIILPLPPLAEQKRIVAKVDELLARCAALERKLGQAQGAGRQLTAAVLAQVVC